MKDILKYLTRENITLCIAIFGAMGTCLGWIIGFFRSRKNISMQIIKICELNNTVIAYMTFQNHSRLPISINNLNLIIDKNSYAGFNGPPHAITIERTQNNGVIATKEYMTISFPINLPSLSGTSGYVFFDISKKASENLSTPLTFEVSTNRGNPVQMKLSLEKWIDWEKMF